MTKRTKSFTPDQSLSTTETWEDSFTKKSLVKNLLVLSFAWWICFSAYDCLLLLQSTLNSEQGIGVISIAVQNAGACVISLIFPKYCIKKLGCKAVILMSMVLHLPYIASNFYPHWSVMILSSVFVSAGNPLIWAALCAYLNNLSILYSDTIMKDSEDNAKSLDSKPDSSTPETKAKEKYYGFHKHLSVWFHEKLFTMKFPTQSNDSTQNPTNSSTPATTTFIRSKLLDGITARFFGIHGMIYQVCHITGNLFGYYVLRFDSHRDFNAMNLTCICGSSFCNDKMECIGGNLTVPSDYIRIVLVSVSIVFVVVSFLTVYFFLDEVKEKEEIVSFSKDMFLASFKLFRNKDFIFIFPMVAYIGILSGFIIGDYTQAFIGCAWGIRNIALVSAVFDLTLALSSSVCGWFVKYLGRRPIFIFTALLNAACIVLLLLWVPSGEKPAMLFVVSGFFGFIVGTYSALTRALFGVLFTEDEETAFGNYQLCFCAGLFVATVYSKYLCTSIKVYPLLILSTIAILGYFIVEKSHSNFSRRSK